jgi:hypothetical protein
MCACASGSGGCAVQTHASSPPQTPPPFTPTSCGKEYGRHGKTIDPARHACGACRGRLAYLGRFGRDGRPQHTPAPIKSATAPAASAANGGGTVGGAAGAVPAAAAALAAPRRRGNAGSGAGGSLYNIFMKENFAATKAAMPKGTPHKDVMRSVSDKWRAEKERLAAAAAAAATAGGDGGAAAAAGGGDGVGIGTEAAGGGDSVSGGAGGGSETIDLTAAAEGSEEEEGGMLSLIRRLQL